MSVARRNYQNQKNYMMRTNTYKSCCKTTLSLSIDDEQNNKKTTCEKYNKME